MCAVDFIVSSHVAIRPGISLSDLKWHQVDFAEGSLGHDAVNRLSLVFLIVADVVLDGGGDASGLNSVDGCSTHGASEVWVFAEALESTSSKRRSLHIRCRAENDRGSFRDGFGTLQGSTCFDEVDVPRCSQSRSCRALI